MAKRRKSRGGKKHKAHKGKGHKGKKRRKSSGGRRSRETITIHACRAPSTGRFTKQGCARPK